MKIENKSINREQNQNFVEAEQDKNHNKNYVIVMSNNQENMIGYFYLPSSNITDLTIDIGENRVIVENQKTNILIDIYLPHCIDNSLVSAHYDGILYVRIIYFMCLKKKIK